ncbi:MAG: transposase domain-containing protein [Propionivibrio sp.]
MKKREATHDAALYSLIGSAKLNDVDPKTHLREGLSRIDDLLP